MSSSVYWHTESRSCVPDSHIWQNLLIQPLQKQPRQQWHNYLLATCQEVKTNQFIVSNCFVQYLTELDSVNHCLQKQSHMVWRLSGLYPSSPPVQGLSNVGAWTLLCRVVHPARSTQVPTPLTEIMKRFSTWEQIGLGQSCLKATNYTPCLDLPFMTLVSRHFLNNRHQKHLKKIWTGTQWSKVFSDEGCISPGSQGTRMWREWMMIWGHRPLVSVHCVLSSPKSTQLEPRPSLESGHFYIVNQI